MVSETRGGQDKADSPREPWEDRGTDRISWCSQAECSGGLKGGYDISKRDILKWDSAVKFHEKSIIMCSF